MNEIRGGGAVATAMQEGGAAQGNAPSSISLELPLPPSVNAMFRNVKGVGRVKTREYLDWAGHAGWVLRSQNHGHMPGRVVILISAERPNAGADIDNRIKALFDLLVKHKVIEDDSKVVGFCAAWAPKANRLAHLLIMPAFDMALNFRLAKDGAHGGWYLDAPNNEDEFNGDFSGYTEEDEG